MDFGIVDVICARNVRLCVSAFENCWVKTIFWGGENVFRRAAKLQKPRAIAQHVRIQGNAVEFVVEGGESSRKVSLNFRCLSQSPTEFPAVDSRQDSMNISLRFHWLLWLKT
jgi:hypothetical protein